ncbi:MAG: hypothetical protein DRJ39_00680 [Thermoprotei archaeon]|nr:MAG: hypothetical protein DRJ39_00680 [Thermoprotei archaeon]
MKQKKSRVLVFLLTGRNYELSRSEVISVLNAENVNFKILPSSSFIVRAKILNNNLGGIVKRAAERLSMSKLIIEEISYLKISNFQDLLDKIKEINFKFLNRKKFYVRIFKKHSILSAIKTPELEAAIGACIIKKTEHTKVSFGNSDVVLAGIAHDDIFVLGILLKEIKRGYLLKWSPRKRPFFMSSALDVFTSRIMLNLSESRKNSVILDPFAGTGGILIDAVKIGCDVVGIDVKPYIAKGCLTNLKHYVNDEKIMGVIQCDSLALPLRDNCVSAIVTDPPYGRSSTTLGRDLKIIYSNFIDEAARILKNKSVLTMLYPSHLSELEKLIALRFSIEEKYLIRVHKGLVRVLVKARKVE